MALIPCPKCRQPGFTWYGGETASDPTDWRCHACGYDATEDESRQRHCPTCGELTWMFLTDAQSTYRYCHRCISTMIISG